MTAPLVSICIPTYNAARTLAATLRSILSQTYPHLQVIISDNASTDETVAIARSFDDPRLEVRAFEVNVGAESNFERCLTMGTGRYTAVFHADDLYLPTMVERQVAFLEGHPEAGAVVTDGGQIDELDRPIGVFNMPPSLAAATAPVLLSQQELVRTILQHGNFVICPAVMARTEVYQQEIKIWDGKRFGSSADLDVWLRVAERHGFGYIPERLINYRRSQQQGSHVIHYLRTGPADFFRVIDHYMATPAWQAFLGPADFENYRRLLTKDLVIRACNALVKGDEALAREILREVEGGPILRDALKNKRNFYVLATWLAVQAGLITPQLTSPALRRIAKRAA